MRKIIEVTQEDIDVGRRRECFKCPIARAMSRALGQQMVVGVADASSCGGCNIDLPPTARRFIGNYDMCRPVEPFSFEIEIAT